MRRRFLIPAALIALTLGPFLLIALYVELPMLVLEPGPAPDVAKRSKIAAQTFPSKGSIHLTTARVNSPSGSTAVEIVEGLIDGDKHVLPREAVFPSDRSDEQTEGVQAAQMSQSESAAATAALNALGMPSTEDGVFVNEVVPGTPAARRIKAGDVIVAIDGSPLTTVSQLESALEKHNPGDEVAVEVRRGVDTKKLTVSTVESSGKKGKAEIGLKVSQSHRSPIDIAIDAEDIGGPSAGLMFALSIYDRLVPEDLTGGRKIAGTGTIENTTNRSARVGEVGAVDLKIRAARKIGADVFVVPRGEAREARAAAPPNMTVIGVSTLSDAISQLRRLAEAPAERS